jgi:UDP-2,3-diacylglucosamine pyrophosphatase LpxH
MQTRTHYPTIILSDIHIGSEYAKVEGVTDFLKSVNCNKLILNGDIRRMATSKKQGK